MSHRGCVQCRFTVDDHGEGHHAPGCPTRSATETSAAAATAGQTVIGVGQVESLLAPSPCGKPGHRMVDWHQCTVHAADQKCADNRCTACEREDAKLLRLVAFVVELHDILENSTPAYECGCGDNLADYATYKQHVLAAFNESERGKIVPGYFLESELRPLARRERGEVKP